MVRDCTKVLGDNTLSNSSACGTSRQRIVNVEDKVLVALVEVLEAEVELIEQAALESYAPRLACLPLKVLVRQLCVVEGTLAVVDGGVVKGHIAIQT